jgi:hypothetical protein
VSSDQRQELLEQEWLIVRHSGEIPEIAYHGTLYYLCQDPEGPRLILTDEETTRLEDAALARYREIILRDLDPANRSQPSYRGLGRAIVNHQRMLAFRGRLGRLGDPGREEVLSALLHFLRTVLAEPQAGTDRPALNCRPRELAVFARELGLEVGGLPQGWRRLFVDTTTD